MVLIILRKSDGIGSMTESMTSQQLRETEPIINLHEEADLNPITTLEHMRTYGGAVVSSLAASVKEKATDISVGIGDVSKDFSRAFTKIPKRKLALGLVSLTATGSNVESVSAQTVPAKDTKSNMSQKVFSTLSPNDLTTKILDISPENSTQGLDSWSAVLNPTNQTKNTINTLGAEVVNSIPGYSTDFNQKTFSIKSNSSEASAEFDCPSPKSTSAIGKIESIDLKENGDTDVEFCDSDKVDTFMTPLNRKAKGFGPAMKKFLNDDLRKFPWKGDFYKNDIYQLCGDNAKNQGPFNTRLKYNKQGNNITVGFDSIDPGSYCYRVGQSSEQITAEVKLPGKKYRKMGDSILHIDGLNDILASQYGASYKSIRQKASIDMPASLKKYCTKKSKGIWARVKQTTRFKPMKTQNFQHSLASGKSDTVAGGTKTFRSRRTKIC